MNNAKELIKSKQDLEHKIYKMLVAFEEDTGLTVSSLDIEKNNFSYPGESKITNVFLEVTLP